MLGRLTVVRDVHSWTNLLGIAVMLAGMVILVNAEHLIKASSPRVVRLFGREMLAKEVQSMKASSSMVVRLDDRVMPDRLEHPLKALSLMVVTVLGSVRLTKLVQL